mmetsp:Transcript_55/g.158  ORF Transcript_55/g.158 Transcript_55/m.158 type:complete len:297 (-) Transcript_55:286-1176(-)
MKKALLQHLLQRALDHGSDETRLILVGEERGRQTNSLDPFHHQHLPARKPPEDLGHVDVWVVPVQLSKPLSIPCLLQVVDLFVDQLPKLLHHRTEVEIPAKQLDHLAKGPAQLSEDVDVQGNHFLALRTLHFDCNCLPCLEVRLVDLPDGGSGNWLGLNSLKDVLDLHPQLLLDDLERDLVGEGRETVLQLLQLLQVLGRKEVGTGGKRLAGLDERGPQVRNQLHELLGPPRSIDLLNSPLKVQQDLTQEGGEGHGNLHVPPPHVQRPEVEVLLCLDGVIAGAQCCRLGGLLRLLL